MHTGYHARTYPERFKKDVDLMKSMKRECEDIACYTQEIVGRPGFDTRRFHDMERLRTAIAADIVRDLPPEQVIETMFP